MCCNINIKEFKSNIQKNICPFCGQKLKYYDGCAGYEAYWCYDCKFIIDHNGMHLE